MYSISMKGYNMKTQAELSQPVAKYLKEKSRNHFKTRITDKGSVVLKLTHHCWDFESQRLFDSLEDRFNQVTRVSNGGFGNMTIYIATPSEYEMNDF